MPVFIRPGNHRDRLREQQRSKLSLGDFAALGLERGMQYSPAHSSMRRRELTAAEQGDSPLLSPDEATQRYGIEGALSFNEPVRERVAEIKRERKEQELHRDQLLSQAEGMLENGVTLGADIFAAMLDPINVAVSFVPIVSQARHARMAQRLGKTRARINTGIAEGGVGTALVEPLIVSAAYQENSSYTMMDSFLNVTFGSVLGGGLHVVGGKAADFLAHTSPDVHEQALRTAVHQAIEGQPIQIEPIVKPSEPPPEAIKMYQQAEDIKFMDSGKSLISDSDLSQDSEIQSLLAQKNELHEQMEFVSNELMVKILGEQINDLTLQIQVKIAEKSGDVKASVATIGDNLRKIWGSKFDENIVNLVNDSDDLDALNYFLSEFNSGTKIHHIDNLFLKEGDTSQIFDATEIDEIPGEYFGLGDIEIGVESNGNIFATLHTYNYNKIYIIEDFKPGPAFEIVTHAFKGDYSVTSGKILPKATHSIKASKANFNFVDSPVIRDNARQVDFESHDAIPLDLLTKESNQLGSNPGYEAIDPHGKHFYVKPKLDGEDMGQSKIEYLAGLFYKNLGIASPNIHPLADALDDANWRGVASEMIEDGVTLATGDLIQMAAKNPSAFDTFMEGIGVDMWLGNWDAAVTGNTVLKDGVVHRIDFGGTMLYRAQGELKEKKDFSEFVTEIKNFENSDVNAYGYLYSAINDEVKWHKHLSDSLFRLRFINDEQIYKLSTSIGLEPKLEGQLIKALISRRDFLLEHQNKIREAFNFENPVNIDFVSTKKEVFSLMEAQKVIDKIHELSNPHVTYDEKSRLHTYQKDSSFVNAWLRKENKLGRTIEDIKKDVAILDSATIKWEAFQDGVLWRSGVPAWDMFGIMPSTPQKFADELQQFIGQTYTDPGFMGTSSYPKMGKTFNKELNSVVLKVHYGKGQKFAVPLKLTSGFVGESEVIFPRNTSMRVIEVYNTHGNNPPVVVVEVVGEQPSFVSVKAKLNASGAYKQYVEDLAGDTPLTEEMEYTLRDAFNLESTDDIMGQVEAEMQQLDEELKISEFDTEAFDEATIKEFGVESVEDINKDFADAMKLAEVQKKGMVASVACVLRKT